MLSKETQNSKSRVIEVKVDSFSFNVRTAGDAKEGIPVILLHGFPETSRMWMKIIEELSQQGYYCIAPDQRGYSPGARPKGKENYSYDLLVSDVVKIADALGIEKFHLIGHDWGCAIGWRVTQKYPERVKSYTAMSVPHPNAFNRSYLEDKEQNKASSYIRSFQIPFLAEWILSKNNHKKLIESWNKISEEEIEAYLDVFSQKEALASTVNWYRANLKDKNDIDSVSVPVLFIWGNKDLYIRRYGVELTHKYVTGDYRFVELDAGHWLIQEEYGKVSSEIFTHLKKYN